MEVYESSYSPQRRKGREEERLSKSIVKQRLDSLIQNDYAVMRKGKEIDEGDLLLKNHNILVLEYVRGIYDQYHILDPLAFNISDSRLSLTPSAKKTKKKKMHLMSIQAMKYQTPTQFKPNNQESNQQNIDGELDIAEDQSTYIKKDMFQNDTTIRAASLSYFDVSQQDNKKYQNNRDGQKQQRILDNYLLVEPHSQTKTFNKNKKRIQMQVEREIKVTPIEEQASENSDKIPKIKLPEINHEDNEDNFFLPPIPAILQRPKQSIRYQQASRKQGSGYVDESFRYCVGCQQALLHANIKIHEQTCSQFQQVFKMPAEEIVQYLKKKIKKFEESIKHSCMQLMRGDVDEIQQSSKRMMQESKFISNNGVITQGFQKQYEIVIDIGKRWCLITQEINKVNWFLKIRQRIKQEFEL